VGERPEADRARFEVKRKAKKREKIPETGRENPTRFAAFFLLIRGGVRAVLLC